VKPARSFCLAPALCRVFAIFRAAARLPLRWTALRGLRPPGRGLNGCDYLCIAVISGLTPVMFKTRVRLKLRRAFDGMVHHLRSAFIHAGRCLPGSGGTESTHRARCFGERRAYRRG